MNKQYYTYDNLQQDVLKILHQMRDEGWEPELIVGVARGGLIPANYFSQWFNVPLVSFHYSLRDHKQIDSVDAKLVEKVKHKKVLFVDDLCDTGETLEAISKLIEHTDCSPKFATLQHNLGQDVFEPNYFGTEINKAEKDVWIIYPWEQWWSY